MSDLKSMPLFLNLNHTASPRRRNHPVEELLGAAIIMRYDLWIYDCGLMTNNIPSIICISFDIASPTASTAISCSTTNPKKATADGGRLLRSTTAL